jgi:ABC-type Fe3+ transport system permease subunit
MLLVSLTIAVAAGIVLVLAGYLVAIAWALMQARRNVSELADTLEAVAEATSSLPQVIEEVDAAVAEVMAVLPLEETSVDIAGPADREIATANL